jgi:hypothetical protein
MGYKHNSVDFLFVMNLCHSGLVILVTNIKTSIHKRNES